MIEPGAYSGVPVYKLLEAVAHGYIAADHRLLHAILDQASQAIPDLVRFASEDHDDDAMDVEALLLDLFRHLCTPAAIPFFTGLVRKSPGNISDELVECWVQLGPAAVEPLLDVLQELDGQDSGDVPFVLSALRVRDTRILEALTARLAFDPLEAAVCLDIYGDPAAIAALEAALERMDPDDERSRQKLQAAIDGLRLPKEKVDEPAGESFDIWELYSEEDLPELDFLSDEERMAMLQTDSATLRIEAARSYQGSELPEEIEARLLELAKADPDFTVRGICWEVLGERSDAPEVCLAMLSVLQNPNVSLEERAGAAVGLAQQSDDATVFKAIQNLYGDPQTRAKALKAMARSMDQRFAAYPPKHLADPDPQIRGEAIWGIGYLNLSSEAPRLTKFFDDEKYRTDALFAYALSVPGETSPSRIHSLLAKIDEVAGGFRDDEEHLVRVALDQRLQLRGKDPVFFPDDADDDDPDAA